MAEKTENEKLAAQVGQDKTYKDGQDASAAQTGLYKDKLASIRRGGAQAQSTVKPFSIKG